MTGHDTADEVDIANNSGTRSRAVPLSARGGSWGAFVFGGVWALCNGVWFGALSFLAVLTPLLAPRLTPFAALVTLFGTGVWLYLAARGRSLAWAHKRWASYEAFDATQRTWSKVAKLVFAGGLVVSGILAVAFWMMLKEGLSAMKG